MRKRVFGRLFFVPNQTRNMEKSIRRVLPRSFLGRSLLIVLFPLLITQGIALELFYGNFLQVVSRRLSDSVTSEIVLSLNALERLKQPEDKQWFVEQARQNLQLVETWHGGARLRRFGSTHVLGPMDEDLARALQTSISYPFFVNWRQNPRTVKISIQLPDGVLDVDAPRKRLDMGQLWLFVAWTLGSTVLLSVIASLFMRQQVKAIRLLARAAEQFGLGRDTGPIRPVGAQEVRKAAVAFNRMQERIFRFVSQRMGVLAGVSHDLRTPLTRLRLSLAMLPQSGALQAEDIRQDVEDMVGDVVEMEHMIESYLAFARGEGAETVTQVELPTFLEDVVAAARRAGVRVEAIDVPPDLKVPMRPDAMRRTFANLLDNARRHDACVRLKAYLAGRNVCVLVDDDGPGIQPERRALVLRAFESGRSSGTGLGLTIARDIARAHGGELTLEDSPFGGLRVRVILPL
ncbi:HAMP domain-containing protein [Acetobacter sp. TBRC 12305]|uniref:histidine kinase n=1 Tax=Acetobacter garciniae TaxID=2817435 RepID=A0A939KN22_9PROT|nr:ATP-binding protein [Acetobacter garciniae]MBO1325913.1 HAMP domain-containing protein [Acetobacter garciniae]MBX0345813.1 HAMP domain-containing protein [Acetobacter garciniae]